MTPRLRWGLIGCGDIARRRVAPALRDLPNCDLIAVSRARADLAESFANEFSAKKWYADWRELVADPEVNAGLHSDPGYLHAAQAILAAEHGEHVLCEKPMAMDPGECDRMIAACQANNVRLGIAYYRRSTRHRTHKRDHSGGRNRKAGYRTGECLRALQSGRRAILATG